MKIMDIVEFAKKKYGRFGFDYDYNNADDYAESYYEYRKSVEICENCYYNKNCKQLSAVEEYLGLDMPNFGCNCFKEKEK